MMYNTSLYMQGLQCYDDFCTAVKFFSHKTPMLKIGKNLLIKKNLITFEPKMISTQSKKHYNHPFMTFQINLVWSISSTFEIFTKLPSLSVE